MRLLFYFITFVLITPVYAITPGINNLQKYQHLLRGKRIGIVANQTSVVENLSSVDYLMNNGLNIIHIYCPEHGFRGTADAGESIDNSRDQLSGLPITSLYGKNKKPTTEDLKNVDIMIFDIQDVGVRFYTYISTLHYIMEACAEQNIPLIVMDRPNPNAFYIDGPVLKAEQRSFVGMHPVPIVYGMTIGEYAQMINGEGWLANQKQCILTIIPVSNWSRDMIYELPVKPSPNLPSQEAIILYPSTCLFEGTIINEGRGTKQPFVCFGHPDLKNMPYQYIPRSIVNMSKNPKCKDQICYGLNLTGQSKTILQQKCLNLNWIIIAYRNYTGSKSFFIPFFDKLAGNKTLREQISAGMGEDDIRKSWQEDLIKFNHIRTKYLIYN